MNRNGRKPATVPVPRSRRPVLITGGAGFIGTNVAHRFLSAGQPVILYDDLSRAGVERNVAWLRSEHGSRVDVIVADVRDAATLARVARGASRVFHFAAQVAVTTSLENPVEDFEINARGTLNVIEALRALPNPPPLLFTSTNKVYGHLADLRLRMRGGRYEPEDAVLCEHGISEDRCVHFHSPYGCSKGCAEQYVLDYARTFDMPAVVFRMSCIYGPHQFGTEDQGWVAHFLIRGLDGQPVTIYGNGRQVRDILFVDDLIDAFLLAHREIDRLSGSVFNIGGGPAHTTSLIELLDHIEEVDGTRPPVTFEDWRPADQQYYVSDTRRFSAVTGWKARVPVREGVRRLYDWLRQSRAPLPRVDDSMAAMARPAIDGNGFSPAWNGNAGRSDARSKRLRMGARETSLSRAH